MARVRRFRWSDLEGLLTVQNAGAAVAAQACATRDSLAQHWRRPGIQAERDLWVAEAGGEVVAYAGLRPWHSATWLQVELMVHPGWRGRGLGAGLLSRLVAAAQARGSTYLCAVAPDEPEEGGRFLRRHGFEPLVPRQRMCLQPIIVPEARPVAGFCLREAGAGDCAALAEVNNLAYATGERASQANAAGYRRFIEQSGTHVWVCEEEASGQIAGLCEVRRGEATPGAERLAPGHIGSLAVRPSRQGRGLGRWLLARGIAFCQEAGWPAVELNVDRDNGPALRLYDSAGFRLVYTFTVYRAGLA